MGTIRPTILDNYYKVIRQRPDILQKARTHIRKEGQCWLYNIKPHVSGYPRISVSLDKPKKKVWILVSTLVCISNNRNKCRRNKNLYVHRMCMNKMCVNPEHLVLRSSSEIRQKVIRLYKMKWR